MQPDDRATPPKARFPIRAHITEVRKGEIRPVLPEYDWARIQRRQRIVAENRFDSTTEQAEELLAREDVPVLIEALATQERDMQRLRAANAKLRTTAMALYRALDDNLTPRAHKATAIWLRCERQEPIPPSHRRQEAER